MTETLKSPNQQQQAVRSLAEEPFPEHFSELSEIERLGLNKNRFPLTMGDQAELWPKAVAWLYGFGYVGEKELAEVIDERFGEAFEYFKLNVGKYDKDENPSGMLVEKPYKPERVRKLLVLRMLGVNQTPDLRGFFGVRPPVIESPVFDSIHKIQEAERDRFIIGHRSDYPRIDKLFGELEVAYGWKPDAIFNPGQTPRLKLHMRNVYTMEQCLLYLTRALSGSATQQELMRSGPTRGMLWRKVKSRFQPDIVALVEERIKRGRKQKL